MLLSACGIVATVVCRVKQAIPTQPLHGPQSTDPATPTSHQVVGAKTSSNMYESYQATEDVWVAPFPQCTPTYLLYLVLPTISFCHRESWTALPLCVPGLGSVSIDAQAHPAGLLVLTVA